MLRLFILTAPLIGSLDISAGTFTKGTKSGKDWKVSVSLKSRSERKSISISLLIIRKQAIWSVGGGRLYSDTCAAVNSKSPL